MRRSNSGFCYCPMARDLEEELSDLELADMTLKASKKIAGGKAKRRPRITFSK